ncbi:MAG: hypothetical protein CM15mV44_0070 [uncultured marine virus]|nr:MAG: hypothetical protein CM15mV44_0070 [uncultured marine virus]|tara:strand:+ start:325 stop:546 length:222 start_codon:yes stop_codon:yes gene_type:complete
MTDKIALDGKDYYMDQMSDEQKYLVSLIQDQQLKISEARRDIDVATAANKVLIEELKKSLEEEKVETKQVAEG